MKIVTISSAGNIECVVVVNDEDIDVVMMKLEDANSELPRADRCYIKAHDPYSMENALDYILEV